VIEKGDVVSGETTRKVKGKEEGMRSQKEQLFIEIEAERADFHKPSGQLRVQGIIVAGKPEKLVELKAHHALEIELNKKVRIRKKELKQWQIERLKAAVEASKRPRLLAVVMDDEEATIAELKDYGFEKKAFFKAKGHGKRFAGDKGEAKKDFFGQLVEAMQKTTADRIIVAGPGFAKNELQRFLESKHLKPNALFASINSVGVTGLNELLKSKALEKALEQERIAAEAKSVEKVFEEIGKESGLAAYGFEEAKKAVEVGAVQELLVSEKLLIEEKEKTEALLKATEEKGGKIQLISDGHEAGEKLLGIGGIAALLRYKMQ
jgi:protein pelota